VLKMAKFAIEFTPYSRRDPVTGQRGNYIRNAHSIQSSARLKEFQGCVRKALAGKKYEGDTPKEKSMAVRAAFTSAAESCKKEKAKVKVKVKVK